MTSITPQQRLDAIKLAQEILDADHKAKLSHATAQYNFLLAQAQAANQPPPKPFSPINPPTVEQVIEKANLLFVTIAGPQI